ncbi:AzlD domain-containing protein [Larsenimonas rhizosphaerae]|uniref:AzlD domain-containing protein n=1 Tax=Larsenimonas rhizosphaerae TaxID=2944682 RepID=A0AA41ZGD7_9GAMM|nr:AzlD domain-containing protein [Larsenimonas rhizosphaerae]MCX2524050.1 AzlD domain-containing protein [Larsenimonas rhizosphaerae]
MTIAFWAALIMMALGTWLMRALPLWWVQRRRARPDTSMATTPYGLIVAGPLLIAGLLGVSLVPSEPEPITWLATLVGALATILCWRLTHRTGLPILAGVAMFGVITWLAELH